jgi:hypothetical protein
MKHRLTIGKSVNFTEELADKIQNAADTLNVSFQDVVRECVEIELPKLIDRERKRTKRGQFLKKS